MTHAPAQVFVGACVLPDLGAALPLMKFEDEMPRVTGASFSPGGPLGPSAIRMRESCLGPFGAMTRGVTFLSRNRRDAAVEFCALHDLRGNFIVAGIATPATCCSRPGAPPTATGGRFVHDGGIAR